MLLFVGNRNAICAGVRYQVPFVRHPAITFSVRTALSSISIKAHIVRFAMSPSIQIKKEIFKNYLSASLRIRLLTLFIKLCIQILQLGFVLVG